MTTRPDPRLAAGIRWCATCRGDRDQGQGFPLDAVWLDDDLILATFSRVCEHFDFHTMIIVPSALTPMPEIAPRCAGTTAAGAPCQRHPRSGDRYCSSAHARQGAGRAER